MVNALRRAATRARVRGILELLAAARPRAELFRAQLLDDPAIMSALDPLIPAIVQTIAYWSDGDRQVSLVHDEHRVLTAKRIARLKEMLDTPDTALHGSSRAQLANLRLVDSRSDSRVQLADFLAGVARKIASDELNQRGDLELTALLRPYVDSSSVWGDDRSWSLLAPNTTA
jgi:hypothetical protein